MPVDRRAAATSLLGGLSLVAGFALASATGARWAGGAVLLAGAGWCAARALREAGWVRTAAAAGAFAAAFALAHPLGARIGPWPSAVACAAAATLACYALLRQGHPGT